MAVSPSWSDLALRLLWTVLAGAALGWDRSENGRAAGLRTTILVALAASLAMIEVNLLLTVNGKEPTSFVVLDLMRLPLGILSGMGFIGAGAIIHRGDFVTGITTAATMWLATVLGLCFGARQNVLGFAGLGIGMAVLTGLKFLEDRMKKELRGKLSVITEASGPGTEEICNILERHGVTVQPASFASVTGKETRRLGFDVRWRATRFEGKQPGVVRVLSEHPGVTRVVWKPAK